MKTILVSSILLTISQASFSGSKNFNAKYGIGNGGFGFGPAIEYKVSKRMTVGILSENTSLKSGTISASSKGIGINTRYYFKKALKQSYYLQVSYISGTVEGNDDLLDSSVIMDVASSNFTFGKVWMWDNFNTDASIGIRQYSIDAIRTTGIIEYSDLETTFKGEVPSLSFTIGYAF